MQTLYWIVVVALSVASQATRASAAELEGSARPVIQQFLLEQTKGLPGKVSIRIDTPMSGQLPPCDAPEPFLPNGARLWGRVSVGVRCRGDGPSAPPWSRYVPAYITVTSNYYVSRQVINVGEKLTALDLQLRQGDLSALPRGVITNPQQAVGMIASNWIASGAPLRAEFLKAANVIQQGQNVKIESQGSGFVVSTEARAMTNAGVGTIIQVRTQAGQMLSGTALADGSVVLPN